MKNFTLDNLRDLIDVLGIACRKASDGTLVTSLSADEEFGRNVIIVFRVQDKCLTAAACAADYQISPDRRVDALDFCNRWNFEKFFPKAQVDDENDFRTEMSILIDEDVSEEFLKENFIRLMLACSWQFFVQAGQEFPPF